MEQGKGIRIDINLKHQLNLSAQLLQSMEILQMTSQELLDYLRDASMENPVLELDDTPAVDQAFAELQSRIRWLDSGTGTGAAGGAAAAERSADYFGGKIDWELESLEAFLKDQLERKKLPAQVLAVAEYLAANLTEDGYLLREDIDAVRELSVPEDIIARAVQELQALEPAGVAAADLRQCLLLQLERLGKKETLAWRVVKDYLQELGRRQYGSIAEALGVKSEKVRAAAQEVAALNPRPGGAFCEQAPVEYVRPDMFVVKDEGMLRVLVNEYYLPQLSLSDDYLKMLESEMDQEVQAYLQKKIQQARWVCNCLARRHATLLRCGEMIMELQRPFFEEGVQDLQPMTLGRVAEGIGMHPSTVSRAIRGKYLQCEAGTFPIRFFFSRAMGESGAWSAQRVRRRLAELVRLEDKEHPLSDQKLAARLGEEGAEVARRTVAKYRKELGIASACGRKIR